IADRPAVPAIRTPARTPRQRHSARAAHALAMAPAGADLAAVGAAGRGPAVLAPGRDRAGRDAGAGSRGTGHRISAGAGIGRTGDHTAGLYRPARAPRQRTGCEGAGSFAAAMAAAFLARTAVRGAGAARRPPPAPAA